MNSNEGQIEQSLGHWKSIALEVLGNDIAGQELVLACNSDEDYLTSLKFVFEDLETQCWEQFRKKQEVHSILEKRKKELEVLNNEIEANIHKASTFEEKMLKNLNLMFGSRNGDNVSEPSSTSLQEMEINGGNYLIPGPRKFAIQSGGVSTMANSSKTIRLLDERLQICVDSLEQTKSIVCKLMKQELYQGMRIKTMEYKFQNLDSLESLRNSQLNQAKQAVEKANLNFLRKKRHIQALKTLSHEEEVEPRIKLGYYQAV
jgi:hypothetical protein